MHENGLFPWRNPLKHGQYIYLLLRRIELELYKIAYLLHDGLDFMVHYALISHVNSVLNSYTLFIYL